MHDGAHVHTVKQEYLDLHRRLEKAPIGAPARPAFFAILEELFTPEECRVAAAIPMRPASAKRIAGIVGMGVSRVNEVLDVLVRKGLVVDLHKPAGGVYYFLNPPVIGFFEFTMMRIRDGVDQAKVARLMKEYFYEDPELAFLRMLNDAPTFIARPLVHEDAVPPEQFSEILDEDRASEVVDSAGRWSEGLCHCRHVARHTGKPCVHPEGHCLALGMGVEYLVRAGIAKRIDKARAREVLAYSRANGLVMMADNVKRKPTFICNCCGCCCEMLHGIRMLKDMRHAVVTSGWVASPSDEGCNGCGACASACPIEAIDVVPATASREQPKRKKRAVVRGELCLGCGVCKRACKRGSMIMRRLPARVWTPETMMEKMMVQALERGKLQHLLFDDPSRLSHRVLGAFVGMALNAPPARRYLLRDNVKSRFVRMLSEATFKSPAGWVAKL